MWQRILTPHWVKRVKHKVVNRRPIARAIRFYLDKNGKETVSATDTEGNANRAKSATGLASLQSTLGLGYGSDKENQSSTTKSGINTSNIEIRDQAGQLAKTGETVEQTLDSIKNRCDYG